VPLVALLSFLSRLDGVIYECVSLTVKVAQVSEAVRVAIENDVFLNFFNRG